MPHQPRVRTLGVGLLAMGVLTSGCSLLPFSDPAEKRTPDCSELSRGEGVSRFVVDWDEGERAALESEMKEGVALVRYTCEGIKVLEGCSIAGQYGYKGTERKTNSQQISDALTASANLSTPLPGAGFNAVLDGQRAIDLAYVTVGALTTPMRELQRAQIQGGHCQTATHFVYRTQQGAFVAAEGKRGQLRAEAELLRYGGGKVGTSTEQKMLSSVGDPGRCNSAKPDDSRAPHGCNAPVRVSLLPIATTATTSRSNDLKAGAATADINSCPGGMVFNGEICVAKTTAKHFVCSPDDEKQCAEQCDKGNSPSCGNLASILLWRVVENDGDPSDFQKYRNRQTRMQDACDDGAGDACSLVAMIDSAEIFEGEPTMRQLRDFFSLLDAGCRNASHFSCTLLAVATDSLDEDHQSELESAGLPTNARAVIELMNEGCNAGSARTCAALADIYFDGIGSIEGAELRGPTDVKRAASFAAKACLGGIGDACFFGALIYATDDPDHCEDLIDAVALSDSLWRTYRDAGGGWPSLNDVSAAADFCEDGSSIENVKQARTLADKACTITSKKYATLARAACQLAKHLN